MLHSPIETTDNPGQFTDTRRAVMTRYLDPVGGDRRQEIVFIGNGEMDEAGIRGDVDA